MLGENRSHNGHLAPYPPSPHPSQPPPPSLSTSNRQILSISLISQDVGAGYIISETGPATGNCLTDGSVFLGLPRPMMRPSFVIIIVFTASAVHSHLQP